MDKDASMPSRAVEENDDEYGESGDARIKNDDDEWRSKEEAQLYRIQTRSQRAETVVPDQRDDG